MGMHSQEILVYRVDAPPKLVETYQGDKVEIDMTPNGFVIRRCYETPEQRQHGDDCMTTPDQIETTTRSWNGKELVEVSTIPYQKPPTN